MPLDPVFVAFQAALAGHYSIDRELGRGGMGIVYLAHEVHLDRLVAIKLLPPDMASDAALRDRFLREARLAARLSHPNIIPIHAVAEDAGFVFYVMAFIDGETLGHRVRTRGPLVGSDAARLLREVAWALAHAHGQGLVHRDVKPDNILIEAASGRALVADFGIAAAMDDASGQGAAGTPQFMSPEQAAGGPIDARSDLYSLGATGFYAVSGSLPFEGSTYAEILTRQLAAPAPPLTSLGIPVPRRLAALVDRCLERNPDRRPANADEVADQLGLALEQRRELPAALRAFVKRSSRLNGGGTIIAAGALLTAAINVGSYFGGTAGFATLFLGAGAAKLGFLLNAARRLLRQGFTHGDLAPAFQREKDQASEELAVELRPLEMKLGKVLKVTAVAGLATGVVGVVGSLVSPASSYEVINYFSMTMGSWYRLMGKLALFGMTIGAGTGIGYLALLQQRRDVDLDFWSRIWTGPLGRAVFAIARRTVTAPVGVSAMTHRATELSLGFAAEQLYEALPRETRQELRDVPVIMQRLQDDARVLRKRLEQANGALGGRRERGPEYDELLVLRDETQSRLGEVVAALETIRLNLLRLHAGQSSVGNLTTHLSVAADVSAQVERLVAAHEEIEQSLRLPRELATTPV